MTRIIRGGGHQWDHLDDEVANDNDDDEPSWEGVILEHWKVTGAVGQSQVVELVSFKVGESVEESFEL
jgi:hypothetical protein